MLVKNWMSKTVITVDVNDSMQHAIGLIKENKINMLPVLEKGKLVGVITDRDLKKSSASDATTLEIHELLYLLSRIKIKQIMTRNPITVPPDYTLEETSELLLKHKISGMPVVDKNENLVGVISKADIFKAFISLSGFGKRGIQIAAQIEDRPGSIKEITDIIRELGGRIVSILTSYDQAPEGYRKVYIRCFGIDRNLMETIKARLKQLKLTLLYLVDHRENKREIYD